MTDVTTLINDQIRAYTVLRDDAQNRLQNEQKRKQPDAKKVRRQSRRLAYFEKQIAVCEAQLQQVGER